MLPSTLLINKHIKLFFITGNKTLPICIQVYSYFEKGCRKKCTRQCRRVLWVILRSLFFKESRDRMAREAVDICLRVLKESNKGRFDSYKVRTEWLIISHITFRDCRVHIFPTTFLEIAVCKNARYSRAIGLTWNMLTHYQIFRNRILAFSAGAKIARERRHPPFLPHIFKSFRDSLRNYD